MTVEDNSIKPEEYSVRYCAFVDILGFTGVIDQLKRGTINHGELRDILAGVHQPFSQGLAENRADDLKTQSISDAVCLSSLPTKVGLASLFRHVENIANSLLDQGMLARGALVKGRLYHDNTTVFGEALVDAYRLESQVARYPRIMVSRQVAEEAKAYATKDPKFGDFIRQGDDGPYFLHVLRIMDLMGEDVTDLLGFQRIFRKYAAKLQSRFDAAADDPRHFEKMQWYAKYWNAVASKHAGLFPTLQGPGLNTMTFDAR